MKEYVWNEVREQEFCAEIYNAYKKILEERKNSLKELQNEKQKLKDEVAEKFVKWKIVLDADKKLESELKDYYSDLNEALNKYEEYCNFSSNIGKEARLQSEIKWLERAINKK